MLYLEPWIILSGNTDALIKSAGSISRASAKLKNTSKENGRAIPGASIELMCDRLTFAYMPAHKQEQELYTPEETFLPEGIETALKRFAIPWRNRWMVKESEIIICYLDHSWGGAVQYVMYAERQGKKNNKPCQRKNIKIFEKVKPFENMLAPYK